MAAALVALLLGCAPGSAPRSGEGDRAVEFVDLSDVSGFSERSLGFFKRGRTCAPADFDGDGQLDLFVGSPQDPAVVLRNITGSSRTARFTSEVIAREGATYWSAAALDLDGDGDPDLLAGLGGNESEELDRVYLNEGGELREQVVAAPLAGAPDFFGDPLPSATAGARWADLDLDGDLDLFLSTNVLQPGFYDGKAHLQPHGRDRLLLQQADGSFTDATVQAGLLGRDPSFNSTLFDYDNDGDVDLYQNTLAGLNHVWRNELVETGELRFTDATWEVSPDTDVRMVDPVVKSFSSAAADLNQDGWEDLVVWHRGPTGRRHKMDWHLVWLNLGGERFVEVGELTGMADRWHDCEDLGRGVMGSQLADLDLDGFPDVFIGNGSPDGGCANQLWLSDGLIPLDVPGHGQVQVPTFRDASEEIDRPSPDAPHVPFPYRTHAACIADYDGDGRPELAYVNGGPGWAEDWVREPNRLFDVVPLAERHHLAVRPVGDGVSVAREAIGTRVEARVRRSTDDARWSVHGVLYGGNGFAAHNGPELLLGLGDADEVLELVLSWPDGSRQTVHAPPVDARVTVPR